jgi:TonB C terminal
VCPVKVPKQQMPTSETPAKVPADVPANVNDQQSTTETGGEDRRPQPAAFSGNGNGAQPTSRWVDYDTHELLEMISELEDERRFARLREGVLWAILVHILLIVAIILLPKYILHLAPAIETSNLQDHKDFTYLDSPYVPRPKPVKPLVQQPQIDKKTLEQLKRESEAPPAPKAAPQPAEQQQQAPVEQKPQPTQPIPPNPQSQSQVEAPRPSPVPARPNFAQLERSPSDQLQQEMRNARRGQGAENAGGPITGLPLHPGAGTGGVQILSDTQGVDFNAWLQAWYIETRRTWDPLIPDECNPPISKQGQVLIDFKVLPNGRLVPQSETLQGRSGDTALDRAAWGALSGSNYPPLPKEFHGPYIELRAWFLYNMEPPGQ